MSVWPAGMMVPGMSGRPRVSSRIRTILLKLKAKVEISSGTKGGRICGSVIVKKFADRARAFERRGLVLVRRHRLQEAHGEQHHVGIAEPDVDDDEHRPGEERVGVPVRLDAEQRLDRIRLISPKFWLNRPLKTRIEMKAGTA